MFCSPLQSQTNLKKPQFVASKNRLCHHNKTPTYLHLQGYVRDLDGRLRIVPRPERIFGKDLGRHRGGFFHPNKHPRSRNFTNRPFFLGRGYTINKKVVVPNIFYFHPENLGRFPILANIFQKGLKPPTNWIRDFTVICQYIIPSYL